MRIDFRAVNLELAADFRDFVEEHVQTALGRLDQHVRSVLVQIRDVNGPKGGNDIHCHIELTMPYGSPLLVEESNSTPANALNKALHRLKPALLRRVDAHKNHHTHS